MATSESEGEGVETGRRERNRQESKNIWRHTVPTVNLTFTYTRPRSNLNMLIESLHATSYLITILIFALAVTILQIFVVEKCMTLTLIFTMGKGQL